MTLEEAKTLKPGDKIWIDGEIWRFKHLGACNTVPVIKATKGDRIRHLITLNQVSLIET